MVLCSFKLLLQYSFVSNFLVEGTLKDLTLVCKTHSKIENPVAQMWFYLCVPFCVFGSLYFLWCFYSIATNLLFYRFCETLQHLSLVCFFVILFSTNANTALNSPLTHNP